jgi:hypothetical protein
LCLLLALSARHVVAQQLDEPIGPAPREDTEPNRDQTVKELMHRGVSEYRKGHLEAARDAFARAFALKEHAAIAATLAEVETKLGLFRAAATHWAFYLEHLPPEREDERAEVEASLAECKRHLGAIGVEVDAPTVKVFLDGALVGKSPLTDKLWVDPGQHTVVAEGEHYVDHAVVNVGAGESKTVALRTARVESGVAPRLAAPAPMTPVAAPVADAARPGEDKSGLAPRTIVLIAGSAATLAAVAVGTTFMVQSKRAGNSVNAIKQQLNEAALEKGIPADEICYGSDVPVGCADLSKSQDDQARDKNIAMASFITAGGVAVVTVGAYFLWPESSPRASSNATPRLAIAPWFSRTEAGVQFSLSHDFVGPVR